MAVVPIERRRSESGDGAGPPPERMLPPFSCELDRSDGRTRLVLEGELDLHTAETVERALRALRASGEQSVDVDLADLTFMDSAGLHLMIRWSADGGAGELSVAIVNAAGQVRRVFELTGATHLLTD